MQKTHKLTVETAGAETLETAKMITAKIATGLTDTKLCNTRTIISASSKCNIKQTQFSTFTFTWTVLTGFLEYLSNMLCRGAS